LLLEDHPEIIIPYTDKDDIANKNITPKDASETTEPYVKGNTDQFNKLNPKVKIGAITKRIILDKPGIIVSLNINLKASLKGCNNPKTPTTLGPRLR
jgi:hypothetical protein